MEIASPVGLHGLYRRGDGALNERPAAGRPARRTPAVNPARYSFLVFQLFQAATSAQPGGSSVF